MTLSQLQDKYKIDDIYFDNPFHFQNRLPSSNLWLKFITYDIGSQTAMLFKKKMSGDYLVRVVNNVTNDIDMESDVL